MIQKVKPLSTKNWILGMVLGSVLVSPLQAQDNSSPDNATAPKPPVPLEDLDDAETINRARSTGQVEIGDIIQGMRRVPRVAQVGAQVNYLHNVHGLQDLVAFLDGEAASTSLNGRGIEVFVWDGGRVQASHYSFGTGDEGVSRVTFGAAGNDAQTNLYLDNHATHVAGTIAGNGVGGPVGTVALGIGVAPEASIRSFDFRDDLSEMEALAESDETVLVSNHSYGFRAGWGAPCLIGGASPTPSFRWVWYGGTDNTEDPGFGQYSAHSAFYDYISSISPNWTQVVSAGNTRAPILNPYAAEANRLSGIYDQIERELLPNQRLDLTGAKRHAIGRCNGLASEETRRSNDFDEGGFDSIPPGNGTAKNVLTVGAMIDPERAWDSANENFAGLPVGEIRTTPFSSWGPTDDGRIKPDVVANGATVYAPVVPKRCELSNSKCKPSDITEGFEDRDAYARMSGTSMSAPAVSGIVALLQELSIRKRGRPMRSDEIKASLIQTAQSPFEGPDYRLGWGAVEAMQAGLLIVEPTENQWIDVLSIKSGEELVLPLNRLKERPGRITVVWLDWPGEPKSELNDSALALVNDLDIELVPPLEDLEEFVDQQANRLVLPWILDPEKPDEKAKRGRNFRDNVERIDVPESSDRTGVWTLRVKADQWPEQEKMKFAIAVWGFSRPIEEE